MSRDVLIETPENIAIEYELAGLGTRFSANFADTILQLLIYGGIFLLAILVDYGLTTLAALEHWRLVIRILATTADFVVAGAIVLSFIVFWGYYIYFEYRWNGQTPGKRSVGLRVIREAGYPVDIFSVVVRNLLRIIDFLPLLYFAGMTSIFCSRRYQRIGDILAGTIVVKQRPPLNLINLLQSTRLQPEHLDPDVLAVMQREADRLSPDEYQAVRHFTERRRSLTNWNAAQDAAKYIAIPLMDRLGITPPEGVSAVNYADVLEYLAVAYEAARRPKEPAAADFSRLGPSEAAKIEPSEPIAAPAIEGAHDHR